MANLKAKLARQDAELLLNFNKAEKSYGGSIDQQQQLFSKSNYQQKMSLDPLNKTPKIENPYSFNQIPQSSFNSSR